MLIFPKLEKNEAPDAVKLHKMDIWVQIYDLPQGFVSDKILQSIRNYVGVSIKTDSSTVNRAWKMYV